MERAKGAAELARQTIHEVAKALGGTVWAKQCVIQAFNTGLADRLNHAAKAGQPTAAAVNQATAWALAADVDLERECRHLFDFFCHKPPKPLEGDPVGDQLTMGCIAFLSVSAGAVYLTTGNAVVQVAAVMASASGGKTAYLTIWGDHLSRHLGRVPSDATAPPIFGVTDPVAALAKLVADHLDIRFPEVK